jgi:hypothetical protein
MKPEDELVDLYAKEPPASDGFYYAECVNAPNHRYETGGCVSLAALDEVIEACEERWSAPPNTARTDKDEFEHERRGAEEIAAHLLSRMTDEQIDAVVIAAKNQRLLLLEHL